MRTGKRHIVAIWSSWLVNHVIILLFSEFMNLLILLQVALIPKTFKVYWTTRYQYLSSLQFKINVWNYNLFTSIPLLTLHFQCVYVCSLLCIQAEAKYHFQNVFLKCLLLDFLDSWVPMLFYKDICLCELFLLRLGLDLGLGLAYAWA
jgi:hypothetical protein